MRKLIKNVVTHSTLFFVGYWLAGGCEPSQDNWAGSYYEGRVDDLQRKSASYEKRISELEKRVGINYEENRGQR